jgi:hypothetical protein
MRALAGLGYSTFVVYDGCVFSAQSAHIRSSMLCQVTSPLADTIPNISLCVSEMDFDLQILSDEDINR